MIARAGGPRGHLHYASAMSRCLNCAQALEDTHRFCPACGTALDPADSPTGTAPQRRSKSATPTPRSSGSSGGAAGVSGATREARFVAGTVLSGRYRVVGLLGKGGMGEVYRADDLRLEQPVALKFLPEALQHDPERLERFYNEVRMARQVAHPAVCRVYDVGEAEGQPFLSMEFVDGENLASLLRRIGRLPPDKALDIARQLCAGVGAAHQRGVLHRDLKPANVMLDGRGQARIMDFGLAGVAASFREGDLRSGTPAYMSPEQLEGREVSARSEVYALGLVLYELFTGRKAFDGRSHAELLRRHREEAPAHPSELVPEIDPGVERAILRCLEKDPQRRPSSALALLALLPGGDPLAAALAAGETPSPELVAAVGEGETLGARRGWTCLALLLVGLLGLPFLARRAQLHQLVPVERSVHALDDRAHELVRALAPPAERRTSARGFQVDHELMRWQRKQDASTWRWAGLRSGVLPAVQFWYRQSPRPLLTANGQRVYWDDPALDVPGMAGVRFDSRGRLLSFYRVPPQVDEPAAPGARPEADWAPLFAAAGLERAALREVEPRWTPPFFCDARRAWEGAHPERPDLPLRVEAAEYRGRPVAFYLIWPWTLAARAGTPEPARLRVMGQLLMLLTIVCLVIVGAFLALRHERRGRSDRRGAFRLAVFSFAVGFCAWLLGADHLADTQGELLLLVRGTGNALLAASLLWLFYLALEPYVRRLWPRALVAWTRLLGGGLRDAAVGHDMLIAGTWGVLLAWVALLTRLLPGWLGLPPGDPSNVGVLVLEGLRFALARLLGVHLNALAAAMASLLLLTVLRLLLRRELLAALVLMLLIGMLDVFNTEGPLWLSVLLASLAIGSHVLVLLRFGLLASALGLAVANFLVGTPLTPDPGAWYFEHTLVALGLVAALGVYGFRNACDPRAHAAR